MHELCSSTTLILSLLNSFFLSVMVAISKNVSEMIQSVSQLLGISFMSLPTIFLTLFHEKESLELSESATLLLLQEYLKKISLRCLGSKDVSRTLVDISKPPIQRTEAIPLCLGHLSFKSTTILIFIAFNLIFLIRLAYRTVLALSTS